MFSRPDLTSDLSPSPPGPPEDLLPPRQHPRLLPEQHPAEARQQPPPHAPAEDRPDPRQRGPAGPGLCECHILA